MATSKIQYGKCGMVVLSRANAQYRNMKEAERNGSDSSKVKKIERLAKRMVKMKQTIQAKEQELNRRNNTGSTPTIIRSRTEYLDKGERQEKPIGNNPRIPASSPVLNKQSEENRQVVQKMVVYVPPMSEKKAPAMWPAPQFSEFERSVDDNKIIELRRWLARADKLGVKKTG